jgi:hypothetical protein
VNFFKNGFLLLKFPGLFRHNLILISLLYTALFSSAQSYTLKGHVIDASSRESLAFVNIVINSGQNGGVSDIDGKFTLRSHDPITMLRFSCVGYQLLQLSPDASGKDILVKMNKVEIELPEVVIKPGYNPANRIIKMVIANRNNNDPKQLKSFSYTSYDKMVIGPNLDSIPVTDSLLADSSFTEMKKFFDAQHLFLMETVLQRKFLAPDKNFNKVIASRVSGLNDPLFVFMISQFQSNFFYDEVIKILDKNYVNPISKGSTAKYYFHIEDTILHKPEKDTTFVISYRPFLSTNFDGLKGVLSINTDNWAIENVIAEPARQAETVSIRIQQLYKRVEGHQWFPVQLYTDFYFKNLKLVAGKTQIKTYGIGKSYLSHIVLNPELVKREFSDLDVDVVADAYHQKDDFWNTYRADSLDAKDLRTYKIIDSIGKAQNFDKWSKTLDAMINGRIPWGIVDLNMNSFFRYNRFLGLSLGLGLHSNNRLSSRFSVGGYWGYGFSSKSATYGADGLLILDKQSQTKVKFEMSRDYSESGGLPDFGENQGMINPAIYHNFLVRRMDLVNLRKITLSTGIVRYLSAGISGFQTLKTPQYEYAYVRNQNSDITILNDEFHLSGITLNFRYAYGEKFIKNTHAKVSLGTGYPVVWIQLSKATKGWMDGRYSFTRLDLKIGKSFYTKYLGRTSIGIQAGTASGEIPYSDLFDGRGSYEKFTLYAPASFATMRLNEFVSDRYASVFLSHDFGKLLFRSKWFNPEFALCANASVGGLSHPERHRYIAVETPSKGFFETGFLINNLLNFQLSNLGFGAFYRLGYYSYSSWKDNLALKITINFPIKG